MTTLSESDRQNRIDHLALLMQSCASIAKRRIYWEELRTLIAGRSKETVEAMEKRKGIFTEGK